MKFIDEYRDADLAKNLAESIKRTVTKPWRIMEICGGQTHSIIKFGIDELLPKEVTLIHGPGCPVCVTPLEAIEQAIIIASNAEVILCSYGDMLRVPGKKHDLLAAKANGADIRIIYSPMDALSIAKKNSNKKVVFFAVGFETTAPANAMAVYQAEKQNIDNFSVLVSHVLVPPAMEAVLSSDNNLIQGFLAAGHVCTIMGYKQYELIAKKYKVPIVVAGFEPIDILRGIQLCIEQLEKDTNFVQNEYSRVVSRDGNLNAQNILKEVFHIVPRKWRGIGEIPKSGLGLQEKYKRFDAQEIFDIENIDVEEPKECIAGLILQGIKKPNKCSEFDKKCTPEHPLGAPMVSAEGACNAYYRYRKNMQGVAD